MFELVNLLMALQFGCFHADEELPAAGLASLGKNIEKIGSKYASVHAYFPMLASSNCPCGLWNLNRSPLTAEPLSRTAYYLGSREQGSKPTHCLRCFHEVYKGIFRVMLGPRHAEIMPHFQCSFREGMEVLVVKKTPKTHIQMAHVPQFIAYTNFPLGFTSEQVVEAQHSC